MEGKWKLNFNIGSTVNMHTHTTDNNIQKENMEFFMRIKMCSGTQFLEHNTLIGMKFDYN